MAREQDTLVRTTEGTFSQLGDLIAAGRSLDPAKVKLRATKANVAVTRTTVEADLIAAECDFTGYTAGGYAVTWSSVGADSAGNPTYASNRIRLQPSGTGTLNTIYNLWLSQITSVGPPVVSQSQMVTVLASPKVFTAVTDYIDATIYITLRPDGVVGWIDVED